jgi:hypothetical protein
LSSKGKTMLNDTDTFAQTQPGGTGDFMTKDDVTQAGIILTIASFTQKNMAKEDEQAEIKPVITWAEPGYKPTVCNKTNWNSIPVITGAANLGQAKGKQVIVYNDPTISFGGQVVGGIRFRTAEQAQAAAPAVTPPSFDEVAGVTSVEPFVQS